MDAHGTRPQVFRILAASLAALVIQFAMVATYTWSAARLAPRHLPVVVAGPAVPVSALITAADRRYPGAIDLTRVASADAARRELAGSSRVRGDRPGRASAARAHRLGRESRSRTDPDGGRRPVVPRALPRDRCRACRPP